MNIEKIIKEGAGTILDVRTREEFQGGHSIGSFNIPLNEVQARLEEIKNLEEPVVLCCASGGRSGQATMYLKEQGVTCCNAGSWLDVNFYQSQTA